MEELLTGLWDPLLVLDLFGVVRCNNPCTELMLWLLPIIDGDDTDEISSVILLSGRIDVATLIDSGLLCELREDDATFDISSVMVLLNRLTVGW